jgi:pilus assembly protein CpaF
MADDLTQRIAVLEAQLESLRTVFVDEEKPVLHSASARVDLGEALGQAIVELAPLKSLLDDETITDILINGPSRVFIERDGKLELTDVTFSSDENVFKVAEAIANRVGRTVNIKRPLLDARLPDGSRVNIIAPPLAVDGTSISIRKFTKNSVTLDRMATQGNMSSALADFLKVIGRCRLNIVISGGTGSGKTTLLNAVSEFIDHRERVVTIEDAAELRLQQPHVVRLETRPMRLSHQEDEVSIRDLMKNALRMRPDRIIVGEVRGAEAFDMMQAMNTGHEGSLTTIHANHPRDALARLENMIAMANLNLPHQAIRAQVASAINLFVQISRMRDGHRRITQVSEICGMEGDIITMQDIFTYQNKGDGPDGKLIGEFKWTGIMPRFLRRAAYYGESDRLSAALGVKLPKL